jgi:hypothetical protein
VDVVLDPRVAVEALDLPGDLDRPPAARVRVDDQEVLQLLPFLNGYFLKKLRTDLMNRS